MKIERVIMVAAKQFSVLNTFIEKEHDNTLYEAGTKYPKKGFKAQTDRVKYLQSDENPYGKAFLDSDKESDTDSDNKGK